MAEPPAGLADMRPGSPHDSAETPGSLALVPVEVSCAKLAAELDDWQANAAIYTRRGWLLLDRGPLHVEVAFLAAVPLVGVFTIPVITACVRLDYTNYDLWPPSLTFIDPRTRERASPAVRAPTTTPAGVRDALVDGHPGTGRPFLCLPGIREYHNHPQHTGDDWLLHRAAGAGRLAVICEHIWQRMVRNVVGLQVTVQALPPAIGTQVGMALAQGDLTVMQPSPSALARQNPAPGAGSGLLAVAARDDAASPDATGA
jgi:Predicted metal binding domain